MDIIVILCNDTSGLLDQYTTHVNDEDEITRKVIEIVERNNWQLRPGDSIEIAEA